MPTKDDAKAFFAQMQTFSERVFRALDLPAEGSPNGHNAWFTDAKSPVAAPTGAIMHWTGADTITSTLKWFCDAKSQVSSHMVVADRTLAWAEVLLHDLPLVAALPATAVQCRKPTQTAWHARTWSGTAYGIENQNVGRLQGRDNALAWSDGTRLQPYRSDKLPLRCFGSFYEPYTRAQVQTNLEILRYVNALYDGHLQPARILGHSNVQCASTPGIREDKQDPGPHFPLRALQQALFAKDSTPSAIMLSDLAIDAPKAWRAHAARPAMYAYRVREGRYTQSALNDILQTTDAAAWGQFATLVARPALLVETPELRAAALQCLGFNVADHASAADVVVSIKLAQQLFGLVTDGIVGQKTSGALATRFRQVFVAS